LRNSHSLSACSVPTALLLIFAAGQ
jgi:hypothetical protein